MCAKQLLDVIQLVNFLSLMNSWRVRWGLRLWSFLISPFIDGIHGPESLGAPGATARNEEGR